MQRSKYQSLTIKRKLEIIDLVNQAPPGNTIVVQCVLRRTTVRKSQVFLTPTVADFLP